DYIKAKGEMALKVSTERISINSS
mgnify:CR=1